MKIAQDHALEKIVGNVDEWAKKLCIKQLAIAEKKNKDLTRPYNAKDKRQKKALTLAHRAYDKHYKQAIKFACKTIARMLT
jgi:hypothetical protein